MPLLWRSSRESRSERCKRAFLLAPICKVLLAPSLVSDRATPWGHGDLAVGACVTGCERGTAC